MRSLALLLTTCLLCAQQGGPGSSPVFSSEARLVLLSFNVQRGAYFAPDLKPEDVVLLEDGKPRGFSVFEGPGRGQRPPLELVLLFDTTTLPPAGSKVAVQDTYWDRNAIYSFAADWSEKDSRSILEKDGADLRVSVSRYDHQQLQNLCRSAKDPELLSRAIHRLPEAIPASEAIPLTLPRGRMAPADNPKSGRLRWPLSWTLEAVIQTLNDSAAGREAVMQALVVFSERVGPTTTREEDAADMAVSLGVPVYPVVIGFEEYLLHPFSVMSVRSDFFTQHADTMVQIPRPDQQPSGGAPASNSPEDTTRRYVNASTVTMLRFGRLGPLTGGAALYPSRINTAAITDILGVIRDKSLSQYIVGFTPASSGRPRKHRLKIGIKAEAGGKLVGGERTAVY